MSKVLVTGGAGFIGFHLTKKLLEQGNQVVIVDNFNPYYDPTLKEARIQNLGQNKNLQVVKVDFSDFTALQNSLLGQQIDLIFHLGAQAGVRYSFENPKSYIESNLVGTYNLLEFAKEQGIKKFVFASSSSVYGNLNKQAYSEEDKADEPVSLYAATKKGCENLLYYYAGQFGISAVALRFFTVYGPWGRPDMALFKFTDLILKNQPIEVFNFGKHQRDFTYIDDIVEGLLKSMELVSNSQVCEIINLGNSHPEELEYFISQIEINLGKKAEKKYLPLQAGDVIKTSADISKAKRLLNWQPKISLAEGIKLFFTWYKDYYKIK